MATKRFRLSWGECDPAGIIYYASYFAWMERLHSEWWFEQDLRFDHMIRRLGAQPVTRRTTCDYLAPAKVLDPIVISMRLHAIGSSSFGLRFDMTDEVDPAEPVRVAEAELHLVFVDGDGRSVPIPEAARLVLEAAGGSAPPP